MNMRELVKERILFSLSDDDLRKFFFLKEEDLDDLSDFDLLEVYEETIDMSMGISRIPGAPWSAVERWKTFE